MLSDLKQLETITHAALFGVQVIYKVGLFSVSNVNNMIDRFCSTWRLKRNPMKRWKALQTASKRSLASSAGSRKFRFQSNYALLSKSFLWSWKKWSISFGDGWKARCVCIDLSECVRDWLVGSSQVHLCWLSKGESDWVEGQARCLQGRIRQTSCYRNPSETRSGLCAWYS